MRLFGRALILGLTVVVCVPGAASAAPILADGTTGASCDGLVATSTTTCGLFELSFSEMGGTFDFDNDVALFQLIVPEGTLLSFSATTTSYEGGTNFDPSLALFYSSGQIVTFADPGGSEAMFPAKGTDIDGADFNDQLAVTLTGGEYLLALYKYPNGATIDQITGLDSLLAGFECDRLTPDSLTACDGAPGGNAFAFTATLDGVPAPVPEPGTLTLMAGGAIAGLVRRRRTRKRQIHSSSVSR